MQSQRAIKRKIRAVNNIKKITRAMQLVSASKLKKFQERLSAARAYLTDLTGMAQTVFLAAPERTSSRLMTGYSSSSRDMYLILSAEKGLCGSFNANIIRYLPKRLQDITHPYVITIGRKIGEAAKRQRMNVIHSFPQCLAELRSSPELKNTLTSVLESKFLLDVVSSDLERILVTVLEAYHSLKPKRVVIVYTAFVNPVLHRVSEYPFLPLLSGHDLAPDHKSIPSSDFSPDTGEKKDKALTFQERVAQTTPADMEKQWYFEPSPSRMFEQVLYHYLYVVFCRLCMETLTSEHAARMMAMRNATENAQELVEDLTLQYNKARQASITKELLDIVGTAEALR